MTNNHILNNPCCVSAILSKSVDSLIRGGVSICNTEIINECFYPETKIQVIRGNCLHEIYIKDCLIGDNVLNCTGIDTITAIKTNNIDYAIKIKYNGKHIISSPRHPYFTQRGWVAAKDIQRGDFIISTDKAMRILRGQFCNTQEITTENTVLRDILLSEMENEAAAIFSKSSHKGDSGKKRTKKGCMVKDREREIRSGKNKEFKSNEKSCNKSEIVSYIETDGTQTFSAWGEWSGDDITTAINKGGIIRKLDSGICYIIGKITKGLSDKLQSGFSKHRRKDSNRNRWEFSLQQEGIGQEKRREADFFRVESLKILEQGSCELGKYRDEAGRLYFFDLEIKRHPSFTINEALVHNSNQIKH